MKWRRYGPPGWHLQLVSKQGSSLTHNNSQRSCARVLLQIRIGLEERIFLSNQVGSGLGCVVGSLIKSHMQSAMGARLLQVDFPNPVWCILVPCLTENCID